jgi:type VI secretion system secreted protein VgrG
VYNGQNKPPYALTANKTQSGIKTRSSEKGEDANYNELRFEDKKGSELMLLHAEKDMVVEAEEEVRIAAGLASSDNKTRIVLNKDGSITITAQDGSNVASQSQVVMKSDGTIKTTAFEKITFEAGLSKIEMTKSGDITISAVNIKIDATSGLKLHGLQVEGKADTTLALEGGVQASLKGVITSSKAADSAQSRAPWCRSVATP